MRAILAIGLSGAMLLSACAQPIPDSGAGVGFGDYTQYELERARREAAVTGAPMGGLAPLPAAAPYSQPPYAPAPSFPAPAAGGFGAPAGGGISSADLAAAGIGTAPVATGPIGAAAPGGFVPAPATVPFPAPSASVPFPASAPAFPAPAPATPAATSPAAPQTEPAWSPEADPLRDSGLEARPSNAAPVIVPGIAATTPAGPTGPNIVEYALSTTNQRGQQAYSRFIFSTQGRAQRNCADYASADEAQRDFLARGGPQRDPRGLDPDGDGFACAWDPAPFRAAVRN
jgi:hypothetical protein